MEADFSWVYLIFFLMIPLARILPRVLRKFKTGDFDSPNISQRQYNYQNSEPPKKIIKEKRLRYCDKCGNLMDFHTNYGIKVMKCVSCGKVNALRRVDLDFYHEREAKKNNKLMSIEEKRIRNWFDQYKKMRII